MSTPIDALADVPNANQALPNLVTSGQPSETQFRALRAAGVSLVIDLRDPMEPRECDQEVLMAELGFAYHNIAVTPMTLTDEVLDQILTVLRHHPDQSTLVHCASGNRVGGALLPYLVLDHGFSENDATDAAMRMGLRGADVLQWGQSYLAQRR